MRNLKNYGNKFIAILLLMIMTMDNIPLQVFANTTLPQEIKELFLDGERIRTDDERIINIVPVRKPNPLQRAESAPPIAQIMAVQDEFIPDATLSLQGNLVHANRYLAHTTDGIVYEVFCADPLRRGPETADDGDDDYRVLGQSAIWLNALKYGYPTNPHLSDFELPSNVRLSNVYLTRVAVAMGRNSASNFSGDSTLISNANQLAAQGGPSEWQNYDNDAPPIVVNGTRDATKTVTASGATAESGVFNLAYNRRTNREDNPFRFEWDSITPDGAELWVDGSLVATAPANVDTVFTNDKINSFELKMPNDPINEMRTAKVNLVGIHNEWADKVWVLRHSSHSSSVITEAPTTGQRQDLVFYIPPVNASASFSFSPDGVPTPTPTPTPKPTPMALTGVIIQKIDAISRENIPGALMRLRGISANVVVTGGTVPSTGDTHWTLNNTGINLSQVLSAGATTASGEVTSTVSDGVWSLEGLPYGAYIVEEERAPEKYSLLPQHTSFAFWILPPEVTVDVVDVNVIQDPGTGEVLETIVDYEIREDGTTSSVLITFENFVRS